MSETNTSLKKDIEDLVNKTIEANKVFINETGTLLKQVTTNKGQPNTINIFQNNFLIKALNAYASLNIQHAKNIIDLGISLTKAINSPVQDNSNATHAGEQDAAQPAFILSGAANAGQVVQLQFVIDNSKKELVDCEFIHTQYISQANLADKKNFKTSFNPQSFSLQPGASQSIVINVKTNKNTPTGLYISNVQVKGFEPAFFSIHITIN